MEKEELKKKINGLEYYISNLEVKKARNILYMAVTLFVILGGGLVLGLIFGSLAKIMMLAVAISALVNVDAVKAIGDANRNIKRCTDQIETYNKQIEKTNVNKNSVQKEVVKEKKNDYTYKPDKEKAKQEVKIERFSDEDYYENRGNKRR